MLNRRRRQALAAWCFVLPGFAVYATFMLFPFGQSIYYSLTSWDGASDVKKFVGLDNYSRLLHDDQMWSALSHNLIWLVIGTVAPIAIGAPLDIMSSERSQPKVDLAWGGPREPDRRHTGGGSESHG